MHFSAITEMKEKKYRSVYKRRVERYCCQSTLACGRFSYFPLGVRALAFGVLEISLGKYGLWICKTYRAIRSI